MSSMPPRRCRGNFPMRPGPQLHNQIAPTLEEQLARAKERRWPPAPLLQQIESLRKQVEQLPPQIKQMAEAIARMEARK